jgi:Domain of unknown function (DUF6894)
MPLYHFNIRNGFGFAADEEGLDLSSEKDARVQAIRGARSLMSADVLEGRLDLNGQIEVTDEQNDEVMTIRFRDVVSVHQGGASGAKPVATPARWISARRGGDSGR